MELLSSAFLLCGLVFPLTEKSASRPEAAELRFRMMFLQQGAGVEQTTRVLRLKDQEWYGGGGLDGWARFYDIKPGHTLILAFRFDEKRGESVLVEAKLGIGISWSPDHVQAPPPPSPKQADSFKVKIRGKLLRVGKSWIIKVPPSPGEELSWGIDLGSAELEQTARRLRGKTVLLSGEVVRPFHFPGIGGESFLVPPAEPRVVVRTLRAVETK